MTGVYMLVSSANFWCYRRVETNPFMFTEVNVFPPGTVLVKVPPSPGSMVDTFVPATGDWVVSGEQVGPVLVPL